MFTDPGRQDLDIFQGGPLSVEIAGYQKTDTGEEVVPPTGYTARAQVRPDPDSEEVLLEMSTTNGKVVVTDEGFLLNLTSTDTDALTPWEEPAYWDLRVVPPSNKPFFLVYGRVRFVRAITQ